MFKQNLQRGFTLIELLVVIAIIGILASVVLASLNTAREKGKDASAKASINNIRASIEVYYDDNGGYGAADAGCGGDVASLIAGANAQLTGSAATAVDCDTDDDGYRVQATMNNGTVFCIDNDGYAGVPTGGDLSADANNCTDTAF